MRAPGAAAPHGSITHRSARWSSTTRSSPIPDADRQTLAVYHAEPGSPSAQSLALLASLARPGDDARVAQAADLGRAEGQDVS
jgi:hypothetical protein